MVGKYYHSLPGSPAVAQVLWHPYGAQSSSLLILTSDALLREYTLSEDVEEPSQTVSFLPTGGGERKGGFSSDDAGEESAVGFCVGEGIGWGPLTVWGLMKNGDVRAVSPFLPRKAYVPLFWLYFLVPDDQGWAGRCRRVMYTHWRRSSRLNPASPRPPPPIPSSPTPPYAPQHLPPLTVPPQLPSARPSNNNTSTPYSNNSPPPSLHQTTTSTPPIQSTSPSLLLSSATLQHLKVPSSCNPPLQNYRTTQRVSPATSVSSITRPPPSEPQPASQRMGSG